MQSSKDGYTRAKECLLSLLFVFLLLAPLSFASYPYLKDQNRNSGRNDTIPQPRPILPWLTFALVVFQVYIAFRQAGIAERQIAIARWQQIATNRPKLVIRKPVLLASPPKDPRTFVMYEVANIGGSDATGFRSKVAADVISKSKYPFIEVLKKDEVLNQHILGAGESITNTHISLCLRDKVNKVAEDTRLADQCYDVFVFKGIIQYTDENMTTYQTGFWREYDFETGRFVRSPDPDYEYED